MEIQKQPVTAGHAALPDDAPWDRWLRPRTGLVPIDFTELWVYRELFWFLAWREVTVRYKQTALGILWVLVQPLVTMVVFTWFLRHLAGFAVDSQAPYAVVTMCGVVAWQFFSEGLSRSAQSMVAQSSLITKVYFPRLIVPVTGVLSAAVDFAVALAIVAVMLVAYQIAPSATILLLPGFALVAALAALGAGLWLCALNVRYRDVRHVIPFVVRIGIYISPVGFLSAKVGEPFRFWYSLNPMVGVIDGFRWCLLGPAFEPYWPGFWAGLVVTAIMLVTGLYYFRHVERTFADIV